MGKYCPRCATRATRESPLHWFRLGISCRAKNCSTVNFLFLIVVNMNRFVASSRAVMLAVSLSVASAMALNLAVATSAAAQALPPPTIAAKSWLLLDTTSNQVIAAHEPDTRVEPASLTKIMTAYLTFAALRDKKLDLKQMITVSVKAWKVDASSSKMFIEPQKPVSIDDLLHGLMDHPPRQRCNRPSLKPEA